MKNFILHLKEDTSLVKVQNQSQIQIKLEIMDNARLSFVRITREVLYTFERMEINQRDQ
jgi:hypothetical protein